MLFLKGAAPLAPGVGPKRLFCRGVPGRARGVFDRERQRTYCSCTKSYPVLRRTGMRIDVGLVRRTATKAGETAGDDSGCQDASSCDLRIRPPQDLAVKAPPEAAFRSGRAGKHKRERPFGRSLLCDYGLRPIRTGGQCARRIVWVRSGPTETMVMGTPSAFSM